MFFCFYLSVSKNKVIPKKLAAFHFRKSKQGNFHIITCCSKALPFVNNVYEGASRLSLNLLRYLGEVDVLDSNLTGRFCRCETG